MRSAVTTSPIVKRSADRRKSARAAQARAAHDLERAASDLAQERTLRRKMVAYYTERECELQREISELQAELACLRAADVPSLMASIRLVLELHQLVVPGPACDPADRPSPPNPLSPAASWQPGSGTDRSSPAGHASTSPYCPHLDAEAAELTACPDQPPADSAWPESPNNTASSEGAPPFLLGLISPISPDWDG
jgi:hypothetical protein